VAGIETPVIIVESGGKDAADLQAADAKDQAGLGEAFQKLIGRALAITRRFETRNGMLRNDVAVPPAPAGK
jgi:hypothetical protein